MSNVAPNQRRCRICARPIKRRLGENQQHWAQRHYCDARCAQTAQDSRPPDPAHPRTIQAHTLRQPRARNHAAYTPEHLTEVLRIFQNDTRMLFTIHELAEDLNISRPLTRKLVTLLHRTGHITRPTETHYRLAPQEAQ